MEKLRSCASEVLFFCFAVVVVVAWLCFVVVVVVACVCFVVFLLNWPLSVVCLTRGMGYLFLYTGALVTPFVSVCMPDSNSLRRERT